MNKSGFEGNNYIRWEEFSHLSLFTRMHCIEPECTALLFTRMHCAAKNSNKNTRKSCGWEHALFAARTQSFLCSKFFTSQLEVLPNLRHTGVFQMSTMVNLGIGFQEPLTRSGVKLDEKMSICSSTSQHGRGYTNSSLPVGNVKVRKCHVILFLRTCMSRKWMWFWPLASN